ncbi:MAG: hypothetical protein IKH28_10030 [Lachnospiraceae bacterium]|nr:hypothetical protein [Lachnospiraceae bacterium]
MKKKFICIASLLVGLNIEYLGIYIDKYFAGVLAGVCFLFLFLSLNLFQDKKNWVLLGVAEIAIVLSQAAKAQLFAVAAIVAIAVYARSKQEKIDELWIFLQKLTFAILLYDVIQKHSCFVFNLVHGASTFVSKVLTLGTPMGDSVSCFAHFWIGAAGCALFAFSRKRKREGSIFLLAALTSYVLYLNAFVIVTEIKPRIGINLLWIPTLFLFAGIVYVFHGYENYVEIPAYVKRSKKEWVFFAGMSVLLLIIAAEPIVFHAKSGKNATLVNRGYLVDFNGNIEENEMLGYGAAPVLFASLKDYVRMAGFQVSIVDSIDEVSWDDTDLVIFANYNEIATEDQKKAIKNYLEGGGAMAVFSDHTDMENIMTGSNSLLASTGIRINEDISDNVLHHDGVLWNHSLRSFSNICLDYEEEPRHIQIFGGASLSIQPDVIPLFVGKYALSDPADVTNVGAGGLLGNRKFDRGEMVGDTCLAAVDYVGKGRVIVFGDTSSIQNTAMFTSGETVMRIMHWLTQSEYRHDPSVIRFLAVIACMAMLLWLAVKKENWVKYAPACALLFVLVFVLNGLGHKAYAKECTKKMDFSRCIAIDESLSENFDVNFGTQYSAVGAAYSFYRYGLVPIFTSNSEILFRSNTIAIIAPNNGMSSRYQKKLIDYVNNGGNVLFALGNERGKNVDGALNQLGLAMDKTNMGPVPWKNVNLPETMDEEIPEFKEAYPIAYDQRAEAKKLYSFNDCDFVVSVAAGKGTCTLLSDSRFFINDNVEGEFSGKQGNVNLVGRIVREVLLNEN